MALKSRDLLTHGGLGQAELTGGGRKAAALRG